MMKIDNSHIQVERALNLVSEAVGILSHIGNVAEFNSDPKIKAVSAYNCETQLLNGEFYAGKSGGCGFDLKKALLSAIGEGVERYCSTFYNLSSMVETSYADLIARGYEAIKPSAFSLFHESQYQRDTFPFKRFTNDTILYWDSVYDVFGQKTVLCPSTFIYMPFSKGKVRISEQISTGFAAHTNYYDAFLNGIYEVIERDAFMISWMGQLGIPKIKIEGKLKEFVESIVPSHMNVHLFDMTTDIKVPSVVGILEGVHDYGQFVAFSAATRMTYTAAINKTVLELCQSIPYYRYLLEDNKKKMDNLSELKSFEDHSIYYTRYPEKQGIFKKWLERPQTKDIAYDEEPELDAKSKIKAILRIFRKNNIDVYCKDITTEDVAEENFKVVRVICPQLIPLNGAYGGYYLGGKRLYEVPEKMGFKKLKFEDLTTMPHPFP
ncbi:YcaO-like family protein [Prevotella histicola]|uniref:YcaO-like family protein n=1 Tax=Prevotella histicola TaxID=470565 RepID=UPI001CB18B15|nr:YcaO-like family protein [Prevotella histicola]MBF1404515.1 YcaO-like family protein [Prevotella histicola]